MKQHHKNNDTHVKYDAGKHTIWRIRVEKLSYIKSHVTSLQNCLCVIQ